MSAELLYFSRLIQCTSKAHKHEQHYDMAEIRTLLAFEWKFGKVSRPAPLLNAIAQSVVEKASCQHIYIYAYLPDV